MNNQVIVITGASSGIGKATALLAAEKKAKVVLAARNEDRLEEIVKRIHDNDGEAVSYKTDVTSFDEVKKLAEFSVAKFGAINVWINNAGVMPLSFINKLKVNEWDQMVDVNIKGVLYGIAAAVPIMEKQQSGHIINVSSIAGHRVGIGGAVYSGTKFAVQAISEGIRQELSPSANIRTTIISPGSVKTELRQSITDEDVMRVLTRNITPKQEVRLDSKHIADAILYAIEAPHGVSINEVIIRPTHQKT